MNRRMVFYTIGKIVKLEAILLLLPTSFALLYNEFRTFFAFLSTIGLALLLGFTLTLFNKPKDKTIFAREGFAIVSLAWIALSAIGALPFVFSGEVSSYTDAFFETVSGFTTTGASVITNVEEISRGLHLWRAFTHWIGGMGVLVLMMAITPNESGRTIHIMRAEMPGPIIGKLVPRIRSTAKILYLIYIFLTMLQVVLLLCGGLSIFESLFYSFATAGTGGFSIKADGLSSYTPYVQWVISIFMIVFGVNFNIYYLLLMKKVRNVFKNEELWVYLSIVAVSIAAIAYNIFPMYKNISDSIRLSAFQVATIISTTGFASADFNLWPSLSKGILFILMFTGACAGSTAGGLKLSRVVLLFKQIRSNLKHMIHQRSVNSVRLDGKIVDRETLTNVSTYFAIYFGCITVIFILLCIFDPFDLETNISATTACFNNIGPGFSVVGPMGSYSGFTAISKWILSAAMLLGRLEIFPMILLFSSSVWTKSKKKI